MAYDDRYDEGRRGEWRGGGDRDRGWRGRGHDRHGHDEDRHDGDRGFFERAGEEVRSWFGGNDEHDRGRDGGYGGGYDRDHHRDRDYGRAERWAGDRDAFGGGWGNQRPRRESIGGSRMTGRSDHDRDRGDRDERGGDDRYGRGMPEGYGARGGGGPRSSDAGSMFGSPGYDSSFAGPRFDRADAGSTGTHGAHPTASATGFYGAGAGAGAAGYGSSARRRAIMDSQGRDEDRGRSGRGGAMGGHDPHYSEWRNRQLDEIDRDYDEYRREHQSRFDEEFAAWRERRGRQREAMNDVREHMEVVGSDGEHIGKVDKVRGEHIVLARKDPNSGGIHHSIPCSWIERVEDKVHVNRSAEQAMREWRDEERSRALFEREDQGSSGPHMLNRSFSGTYSDRDRDRD